MMYSSTLAAYAHHIPLLLLLKNILEETIKSINELPLEMMKHLEDKTKMLSEVNHLMATNWAVLNLKHFYQSYFSSIKINGNFAIDIHHSLCLHIHLMHEGKWGRILAEMEKKWWLEGKSIIHCSLAHISLIIHLTSAPDSREAKIDVCSSCEGLPYKQSIILGL